MSLFDERRAIEDRLKTGWTTGPFASTYVQYMNTPLPPTSTAEYIGLQIVSGEKKRIELSGDVYLKRSVGVINIDIFTKADAGSATATKIGDALEAIFFDATFALGTSGHITVKNTDFHYRGLKEGRAWWTQRFTYWRDSY